MSGATLNADLLVIGAGAAGALAASTAARVGARVVMIDSGASATSMSSGTIDVADAPGTATADPLAPGPGYHEAVAAIAASEPAHPYARVGAAGRARLDRALGMLRDLASEIELCSAHVPGQNMVITTALGTTKRVALAPRGIADGQLERLTGTVVGMVGFGGHHDLDPLTPASTLQAVCRRSATAQAPRIYPVAVDFLRRGRDAQLSLFEVARLFEQDQMVEALARAIGRALADELRPASLLFPPVLGLERADAVRARVSALCELPVAELCALSPSTPGWRLDRALRRGLARAGVEVVKGRVVDTELGDRGVVALSYLEPGASSPRPLRARGAVLASGHLATRGLVAGVSLHEPLFRLPLWLDGVRLDAPRASQLLGERYVARHPLLRVGVATDASLRPLDARGVPAHPRLYAAGAILAGNEPGHHRAGLGLCALTGMLAGEAAIS